MICKLHAIWIFFLYISLLSSCSHICCSARDNLTNGEWIGNGETLVSDGGMFELGFFTPNRSSGKTYVGIWYKWDNQTVVWVANRDNPLTDSNGFFGINASDGGLTVLDARKKPYWLVYQCYYYYCTNTTVKLMNSGNLVLVYRSEIYKITLWESFKNPTDTFLSGMKMEGDLNLTSWRGLDDPGTGHFTFKVDEQGGQNQYSILRGRYTYWKSEKQAEFFKSDDMPMPYEVAYFLSNGSSSSYRLVAATKDCSDVNYPPMSGSCVSGSGSSSKSGSEPGFGSGSGSGYIARHMVLGFSGEIKHWGWYENKTRSLIWDLVPSEEECSVYNTCGDFGSCNRYNKLHYANDTSSLCKCLPGFKPNDRDKWWSGDFSKGCTRNSDQNCGKNDVYAFLNLKMMMGKDPDTVPKDVNNEMDCKKECLDSCGQCKAYSFEAIMPTDNSSSSGKGTCWIWTENLVNLQEEYSNGGRNFSVPVPISDIIEPTVRNCEPCGTNTIPYPLSTGPNCGDPMYFSFYCNASTGQVRFQTDNGTYRITSINPIKQKFVIKVKDADNKDAGNSIRNLQINQSLPFNVTQYWFNATLSNYTFKVVDEVEIS